MDSGDFRKGIDSTDLYISITGLAYTYVSDRQTLSIVFKRNVFRPSLLQARRRTMAGMMLRYLAAERSA